MIKVIFNNNCAKCTNTDAHLTSGTVGKLVEVAFNDDWTGLNKVAVFSNGAVTVDVLESQWNGSYIAIPHEVLADAGRNVTFGVYGYKMVDGDKVLALPSVITVLGKVTKGADPSNDPAADPTLPIWAQLQWEIDHFEVDPEIIAEQVQLYLAEHPIEISPATASVLGGIKVGANLSITADGTLSADAVDLSGYATEAWVLAKNYLTQHQLLTAYRTAAAQDIIDASKQDKLIAGTNITIAADGKTISATGGGAEVFVVNITQSGGVFSADKTNAEIYAAVQANKVVYAVVGENRMQIVSATSAKAIFADTMKTNKVKNGTITIDNNAVTATETALQSEGIADVGNYYTTDTVEGALAEIGAELAGINTLIGSGVIT